MKNRRIVWQRHHHYMYQPNEYVPCTTSWVEYYPPDADGICLVRNRYVSPKKAGIT